MANQSSRRGREGKGRMRGREERGAGGKAEGWVGVATAVWRHTLLTVDGGSKMSARCLFFSSTVARERKARCHIRRFIGPLCCRLIPLRAVLFARLLHLLPLKINSLALPCAPPAAPARARARTRALASVLPSLSRYPSLLLALSLFLVFLFFLISRVPCLVFSLFLLLLALALHVL